MRNKLKIIVLMLTITLISGCGKKDAEVKIIEPTVKLDMQYNYSEYNKAIECIVNNGLFDENNISDCSNLLDDSIKLKIINNDINEFTNASLVNAYRSEDVIFLQISNDSDYYLYKLKIKNRIIHDILVYENLN